MNPNLGYLRTTHGREKIRQWFKRQERAENIARGKEMAGEGAGAPRRRACPRCRRRAPADLQVRRRSTTSSCSVGYGEISTQQVSNKIAALIQPRRGVIETVVERRLPTYSTRHPGAGHRRPADPPRALLQPRARRRHHRLRDARRGRHRPPAATARTSSTRTRRSAWSTSSGGGAGQLYPVAVHIEAWDRVGLLRDISDASSPRRR